MQTVAESPRRLSALAEELAKIPAFFRRDLLVLWSYRAGFFSDWANLFVQTLVFYFVSRIVPPEALPTFEGEPVSYIEFVAVGLILTSFMQVSLSRLVGVVQTEQLMGTLDSLFVTPTAPITFMFGSVAYDLLYVPIRTVVFLLIVVGFMGVDFNLAGLLPTVVILLFFIPFTWGLGVVSAALVLTFKRGSGSLGVGVTLLILGSGAYFPVEYLPEWVQTLTQANPVTIALDAARNALLGSGPTDWSVIWSSVLALTPWAILSLVVGTWAFRMALRRERRRGTMGMY
jgi:ABC-type polysaccharide/polyol phosphate export permease